MVTELRSLATRAGLRYVNHSEAGISRERSGAGFRYRHPDGRFVDGPDVDRIQAIVIPPAWNDVWICVDDRGHIQATGRDSETRKQYRYHERWEELRERVKFDSLSDFGSGLVRLRKAVDSDLRRHEPDLARVSALAVAVLDQTLLRVGNAASAEDGSYGLTTLRSEHVDAGAVSVEFDFTGKGGADRFVKVRDRRLASHVSRLEELPGQELFTYRQGSDTHQLRSEHVNEYLVERSGLDITAKDFRTWGASAMMVELLGQDRPDPDDLLAQMDEVAARLGNSRAVARDSYIHPDIEAWYRAGRLDDHWSQSRSSKWMDRGERTLLRCLIDREAAT